MYDILLSPSLSLSLSLSPPSLSLSLSPSLRLVFAPLSICSSLYLLLSIALLLSLSLCSSLSLYLLLSLSLALLLSLVLLPSLSLLLSLSLCYPFTLLRIHKCRNLLYRIIIFVINYILTKQLYMLVYQNYYSNKKMQLMSYKELQERECMKHIYSIRIIILCLFSLIL